MSTAKIILLGVVVFCAALAFPFVVVPLVDAIGHEKRVELWLTFIFIAIVWGRK